MPNLTVTAYYTRKSLKFFLVGLVAYFFLRLGVIYSIELYKYLNPPPPPAATVGFGMLPKIIFPSTNNYTLNLELQTPDGKLPSFPINIPIYYMPYKRATLFASDQAKKLASNLGFAGEPAYLSTDEYQWTRNVPAPLTLHINISTGTYTLAYQWQADKNLQTSNRQINRSEALGIASGYLSAVEQIPSDIDQTNAQVNYLKSSGNQLIPAISLSEATFVRIDYFRAKINNYDVVTAEPSRGIVTFILSNSQDQKNQLIYGDYKYYPVNYYTAETYPLKSIASAWDELIKGQAYIAQTVEGKTNFYIRRISLCYYDTFTAQEFLQPIYIFSGDDGTNQRFIAYVHAIDASYIKP